MSGNSAQRTGVAAVLVVSAAATLGAAGFALWRAHATWGGGYGGATRALAVGAIAATLAGGVVVASDRHRRQRLGLAAGVLSAAAALYLLAGIAVGLRG